MEKPALGRGLDALLSGGPGADGKKASDMLASFQGKRTRVGKGLGAFIKGGAASEPKPAPAPEESPSAGAPAAPEVATPKPMADLSSMRARRQPRPTPAPQPTSQPNYRHARRPRTGATPAPKPDAPEKSEPAPARLFVGSTNAPDVAKPFTAVSPAPTPRPEPNPSPQPMAPNKPKIVRPRRSDSAAAFGQRAKHAGHPGFRISLFIVDWFLLALAFYIALNLETGSNVALTICVAAVLVGAALGVWGLILETEEGDD